MITKADLTKAGGWTPGCRKCKAMKEGDHSRTNLAHSADCRALVAEILADDIAFRTKMRKAVERKEGARRTMEPFPKVQVWRQYVVWVCSRGFDCTHQSAKR